MSLDDHVGGHEERISIPTFLWYGLGPKTIAKLLAQPFLYPGLPWKMPLNYLVLDNEIRSIKDTERNGAIYYLGGEDITCFDMFMVGYVGIISEDPTRLALVVPKCAQGNDVYELRTSAESFGGQFYELAATRDFINNMYLPNIDNKIAWFVFVCNLALSDRFLKITQALMRSTGSMLLIAPLEGDMCTINQYHATERGNILANTTLSTSGIKLFYGIIDQANTTMEARKAREEREYTPQITLA